MIARNFVVFEGIDGTGTTTQLQILRRKFAGKPVHFTCEPTDGRIGSLIREALRGTVKFTPETMAFLFASDRNEHLFGNTGIMENIGNGQAVFCDRYLFSSLAYQGSGIQKKLTESLNSQFPLPEYLFFFDLDPETAMRRVLKRGGELEIYEKLTFQQEVSRRYRDIIAGYRETNPQIRIVDIDASQTIDVISQKIWSIVKDLPKI